MPVTVDNFGPGPSKRYADDQSKYDASLRKDSSTIPHKTQIAVLSPTPDQLTTILTDSATIQPQASFCEPSFYHEQNTPTFTSQLTPSIGPTSKWESSSQKMLNVLESLPSEAPEKVPLKKFIDTANQINHWKVGIGSEINRYHRG